MRRFVVIRIGIKTLTGALLLLTAMVLLSPLSFSKESVVTFHGVIMDSQCAYNVHSEGQSHDLMTKGAIKGAGTEEGCTLHCVKEMGGSYVLVVKKDVYKLDDQAKPELFAGKKVKVSGLMDRDGRTLHVIEIDGDK